ncbi:B12-binding domain-containing radical SAM protein [Geomonas sp. RF6]|uniref:B12-binding domain-containing radical SAM protein n=1 Tax=Geomonas sp. RF6 TaxID=2897342 RepID=UPI001E2D05C6|nr:radical SAM protein [Geomonas sp. RF6]UFS72064.1 B12-binding domain-containing radical SAM protein [Geomonas sp. RF6]
MKMLLIQPPSNDPLMDQVYLFEPLALEYVGAGLRQNGYTVRLLDCRLEPDYETVLREMRPDVVGLTGYTCHRTVMQTMAGRVKQLLPDAWVIVGGHHATVAPEDFNSAEIDVVVIGEGVFTLREVLRALAEKSALDAIPGLGIPRPEGMLFTPPRPYTDLNLLPMPDRSLTRQYRGRYFSEWFKPLASVRTSLGCTARCTFCALWKITGGRYLRRDPERVVAELLTVEEPNVFFCDDESMCDTTRMDRLADLIAAAGIRKNYFLYGRVDTIVNHPQLFAKWAKIGLVQVFVGMEDFSDARLAAMNKGTTTGQQRDAVRILRELGVMMYASYMVDPEYGAEDFAALKRHVRDMKHNYATFTIMTPLPGTELYERNKGRMLSHRPELFDMLHTLLPTRLTPQEFYAEVTTLYTSAVPLYRALPALMRFGLHGMWLRARLFGQFVEKMRRAHLDY